MSCRQPKRWLINLKGAPRRTKISATSTSRCTVSKHEMYIFKNSMPRYSTAHRVFHGRIKVEAFFNFPCYPPSRSASFLFCLTPFIVVFVPLHIKQPCVPLDPISKLNSWGLSSTTCLKLCLLLTAFKVILVHDLWLSYSNHMWEWNYESEEYVYVYNIWMKWLSWCWHVEKKPHNHHNVITI